MNKIRKTKLISVASQKMFALFVIPGLTRNPVFLGWISAPVPSRVFAGNDDLGIYV